MPTLTVHNADTTIRLETHSGQSVRDILDLTTLRVRAACGGTGTCGACKIHWLDGPVTPLTTAEYMKLDQDEREEGLRLACQIRLSGDARVRLDDPAPPSPWKSMDPDSLGPTFGGLPHLERHIYGLAIDLGTTHIRLALWDRKAGKRIATRMGPNPQAAFGSDVLNRLDAARLTPGRADHIAALARDAILHAVHDILARDVGEVTPMLAEIGQVVVVGNTAIMTLLTGTGIDALAAPENWLHRITYQPAHWVEWLATWRMPHAEILLPPSVAGFIGCDLLADCIATRILDDPPGTLLLDIGTNTEIALWDGESLHVTSVPGGPAFEAAGIPNGMPAEAGAIYRAMASPASQGIGCAVIGGGAAIGFCGSGLLDGIAMLVQTGVLKPSGRFKSPGSDDGHALIVGNPRSAITGCAVDAFQRAKAATAAAQEELLHKAAMTARDLKRLVVCGTFGRHLDIANAQQVGLLPMIDPQRIETHADAALNGCEQALLTDDCGAPFAELLSKTFAINLAMINGYEDRFVNLLRLRPFHPLAD
ncbi:putative 2Fe-2S ferredoxin-like [Candidatus Terasakiella magnetica]|nr:putative 2Fe-2S ferredoxin-like [Candidatus Terasakiella magnetica]